MAYKINITELDDSQNKGRQNQDLWYHEDKLRLDPSLDLAKGSESFSLYKKSR